MGLVVDPVAQKLLRYRARVRATFFAAVVGIFLLALGVYVFRAVAREHLEWIFYPGLLLWATALVCVIDLSTMRCPVCGKLFHFRAEAGVRVRNQFSSACLNCGAKLPS